MRTFTQKPKAAPPTTSRRSAMPGRPLHSKSPANLRAKLTVGTPGDTYDQEADRISEQILDLPEPQLQRACPCGGTCPRCQAKQPNYEYERSPTKRVQASDAGQLAAPRVVDEVLAAPGQPLDMATRGFMESRFGHNFSQVRIHTDQHAARSAEALAAQAYTVGANVVFGTGRYAPASRDGRRLLAHELTHVVQQDTSSALGIVQRTPDNTKPLDLGAGVPEDLLLHSTAVWPERLDYDQNIQMLAANPDHAHRRWKGLTTQAQIGVALYMATFYGAPFANQFVDIHKAAKVPEIDFGQVGSDTTQAELTARGFHLAGTQAQLNVEIWFHPSGSRRHRVIPVQPPAKPPALKQELKPEPDPQPGDDTEEPIGAPVDMADLTDGQRKALALLQNMEHMNADFQKMLDANPPKTSEFIDKEAQFRSLRKQFQKLVLDDDSVSETDFSSILVDRRAAVNAYVQLRNRAYGRTDLGDWEQIEHEPGQ